MADAATPAGFELNLRVPLRRFTLEVQATLGASVALLGPSGAGKSSLLEALAGLRPSSGTARLGGVTLEDTSRGLRLPPEARRLGWVPQDGLLFPHLTVRRNLAYGWRPGRPGPAFDDVVAALELEPLLDVLPGSLSGGESRRVALGRAVLSAPRALLLDEPTTGLDARRARRILRHVRDVCRLARLPVMVVTHREEEALALAEDVIVLEDGRVIGAGPAREVLSSPPVLAARGEDGAWNVARGRVASRDSEGGVLHVELLDEFAVTTGPAGQRVEVSIPWHADLAPGDEVIVGIEVGSVLVAAEPQRALSARNVIAGAVNAIEWQGSTVHVRVGPWRARLTAAAARELALEQGGGVYLIMKTHAWRLVAG